jgi:plastocyanin
VFERVAALVSMSASTSSAVTGQPATFTGHVDPSHAGERVVLQQETTSGDWHTLKGARLDGASNYSIVHRWRFAGDHTVRVLFRTDVQNVRGAANPVTVAVQQKQVPGFTISSADQLISYGQSATISGVLSNAPANTPVTLWARSADQNKFTPVADTTTGSDGSYTFAPQVPGSNTAYLVRTTLAPRRHSAVLFEGVQDVLTLSPSSTTSQVGGHVTFTGTVLPDKAGHVVYLQRLGADGDWHNEEIGLVTNASTFQFGWTFGKAGTYQFRARITGGDGNIGGASAPVTIQVAPTTNPSTLPPAS